MLRGTCVFTLFKIDRRPPLPDLCSATDYVLLQLSDIFEASYTNFSSDHPVSYSPCSMYLQYVEIEITI